MKFKLKKLEKRYVVIFIVALIIFAPYLSEEFISGDDYICHMANIYALDNGPLFSKIRSIMANNLGYGDGIFYPQFSYYVTSLINLCIKHLSFGLIAGVKIYEFMTVFFSGIFMYKYVKETFENKNAAMTSAVIYMTMPYFCSDIFRRMAYAEIAIFLFMPIVMLSINYILRKDYKKFFLYFCIGYSGMICSHLVITVWFTIFLIIMLIYNIKEIFNKKTIISFIGATLIVLCVVSPFILPMLEHMIKGNYVVFSEGAMAYLETLQETTVSFSDLIDTNQDRNLYFYKLNSVCICSICDI